MNLTNEELKKLYNKKLIELRRNELAETKEFIVKHNFTSIGTILNKLKTRGDVKNRGEH